MGRWHCALRGSPELGVVAHAGWHLQQMAKRHSHAESDKQERHKAPRSDQHGVSNSQMGPGYR